MSGARSVTVAGGAQDVEERQAERRMMFLILRSLSRILLSVQNDGDRKRLPGPLHLIVSLSWGYARDNKTASFLP